MPKKINSNFLFKKLNNKILFCQRWKPFLIIFANAKMSYHCLISIRTLLNYWKNYLFKSHIYKYILGLGRINIILIPTLKIQTNKFVINFKIICKCLLRYIYLIGYWCTDVVF